MAYKEKWVIKACSYADKMSLNESLNKSRLKWSRSDPFQSARVLGLFGGRQDSGAQIAFVILRGDFTDALNLSGSSSVARTLSCCVNT